MKAKVEGTLTFDTVVIDTVDRWIDLANEEVISKSKAKYRQIEIDSIGDVPNGAGWYKATELISSYLNKLEKLGVCVVLIGHLSAKEIKDRTQSYHRETISIGGKMGESLLHWSDHTIFMEGIRQGDRIRRIIHTKPTQTREGKSRDGAIPTGMELGEDMVENYKKLRGLFE